MINSHDPIVKQLDKNHKLLKYMMGTKGHSLVGDQYIDTCTCQAYLVTKFASQSITFQNEHKDCSDY